MTEAEAESRAERMMDRLDKRYLAGEMTCTQYNRAVATIDRWVKRETSAIPAEEYRRTRWYEIGARYGAELGYYQLSLADGFAPRLAYEAGVVAHLFGIDLSGPAINPSK